MVRILFLWDPRPGANVDHITAHGMTTDLWEEVFRKASLRSPDKEDPTITVAEGRVQHRLYRIVYAVEDDTVIPIAIFPITGFPLSKRGLRRRKQT